MEENRLKLLLQLYIDDKISKEERTELLEYLKNNDTLAIAGLIDNSMLHLDEVSLLTAEESDSVFHRIITDNRYSQADKQDTVKRFPIVRWLTGIAAALIFIVTASIYFVMDRTVKQNTVSERWNAAAKQIHPGAQRAILKLGNGSVVELNHTTGETLVATKHVKAVKTQNGEVVYNTVSSAPGSSNSQPVEYNTLITPRGGEYQLILADGTHVWLNSASSLSYPVEFNGNKREVKLNGEAYFEVAKDKTKPFIVSTNNMEVQVLGTHFNISSYNDDTKHVTTLLEGAVQIKKNKQIELLKPGQQAVTSNTSDLIDVSEANIRTAMAWKNGYFIFNDEDLLDVMKKIGRWYDVDVSYQGQIRDKRIGGTFKKSKSIKALLQHLEKISGNHFDIKGRRIIVMR